MLARAIKIIIFEIRVIVIPLNRCSATPFGGTLKSAGLDFYDSIGPFNGRPIEWRENKSARTWRERGKIDCLR